MEKISQKQRKKEKKVKRFSVDLIFQRTTEAIINKFLDDDTQSFYEFPTHLTTIERGYIHQYIQRKGLKSKSRGKNESRYITVFKPKEKPNKTVLFTVTTNCRQNLKQYLKNYPLTSEEMAELTKPPFQNRKPHFDCSLAPTNNRYKPIIPTISLNSSLYSQRIQLPIYEFRQQILDVINGNQITVISAETGAGKSTQIPQYILEDYALRHESCKIICTQPRRVAAIAVSQRVAQERNEKLGITVGYQIRLESQMSPMSNLIYTTTGYFLRCLVGGNIDSFFRGITHIILDEIHERDKHSDFVLIAIREHISKHPQTKIILMSATIDSKIFSDYFGGCPVVEIPGRVFPVVIHHLEDVLHMTGFGGDEIQAELKQKTMKSVTETPSILDKCLMQYVNEILEKCWYSDDGSTFDQFYYLVSGENVPIDIKHSDTQLNALMIAAGKGLSDVVLELLKMGANPAIIGGYNMNALQWAEEMKHWHCVKILNEFTNENEDPLNTPELDFTALLKKYETSAKHENVDHVLLSTIIFYIHTTLAAGSILIFLPGYDDILEQKEILINIFSDANLGQSIEMYMLHSSMQVREQRQVFLPVPENIRKIILSTNIAETSITIDDVGYVIDCGKVKQKSFDAITGSTSLTSVWVSKACATQRMGRAGRTKPGICYRLFSRQQYDLMDEYTLPEILRVPLPEICLHAKILSIDTSIGEFLSNAIQPPPKVNIQQSIRLLQNIGALDATENITELGMRLVDLPLDVQLGKALLYSVFYKCFDPILTIVSILSVKDPFLLPGLSSTDPVTVTRKSFSEETLSDHMVFLKLFKSWMDAKARGQERNFCRSAGISNGTMELICGTRSHILGCLRSHKIANNSLTDININSSNWSVVKACLISGLYPNVCLIDKSKGKMISRYEKRLLPHPAAVLRDFNMKRMKETLRGHPNDWIIYGEKIRNEMGCLIRHNTTVSNLCVALFCGPYYMPSNCITTIESETSDDDDDEEEDDDEDKDTQTLNTKLILDDWIEFRLDVETAHILRNFRHKLNAAFLKMLRDIPSHSRNKSSDNILHTIAAILREEDNAVGLPQPTCVGYRPVAVKLCFGSDLNFGIHENVESALPTRDHTTTVIYSSQNQRNTKFKSHQLIGDQNFIQSSKFIIVHASNKIDVFNALRNGQWTFSDSLLQQLLAHRKKFNAIRLILFFYIKSAYSFCGASELVGTSIRNYGLRLLSEYVVTLKEPRMELPYNIRNVATLLPTINDGEEIIDKTKVKYLLNIMFR